MSRPFSRLPNSKSTAQKAKEATPVKEEIVETEHVIEEQVVQEEVVHEEVVHEEDMIQVQHEEVLEEIVEEDGLMYDTDGRVIEYPEMLYDEEAEVIEEYVEVEDMGDGRFAYVMTDEHGNRRLLKEEEVDLESWKKKSGFQLTINSLSYKKMTWRYEFKTILFKDKKHLSGSK
ncbi:hypothetical protein CAEBREN_14048 [Caenorhabditis brenneri]|uniref:Uncharacterized protein n=1 Tax=Caenorhabditis brenneri TaxID=135651 RepID=G0MQ84_CAEBE|nr:hypothetical protein CAEBREN_14048 [Caenorhabditis brenneri]